MKPADSGALQKHTIPYHPQGDRLVERFLLNMLSTAANSHLFDWEKQLRPLCIIQASIQPLGIYSPFWLTCQYVQIDPSPTPNMNVSTNQFASDLCIRMKEARLGRKWVTCWTARKHIMTNEYMQNDTKKETWCDFTPLRFQKEGQGSFMGLGLGPTESYENFSI